MSSSFSNLFDNPSEWFQNDKCTDCEFCLEYLPAKDNLLIFKCLKCKKNHNKEFNEDLINGFEKTYQLCNGDIDKFILLLRKGVYPYEYMNTLERFDEILLPHKEDFYNSLNIENITDADYKHPKSVFKEFKMNNLGNYHTLYV